MIISNYLKNFKVIRNFSIQNTCGTVQQIHKSIHHSKVIKLQKYFFVKIQTISRLRKIVKKFIKKLIVNKIYVATYF